MLQLVRLGRGWSGAGLGWGNRTQPRNHLPMGTRDTSARCIGMGTGMPLAEPSECSSCAFPPNPLCFLSTRDVSELTVYRCSVLGQSHH